MFKKQITAWLALLMICTMFVGCNKQEVPADKAEQTEKGKVSTSFAFYIKDGELMMVDTEYGTKTQLTTALDCETRDETCQLRVNDDATCVFFVEHETLYMCRTQAKSKPQKLDDKVLFYDISRDGKTVLYAKENPDTGKADLYLHDLASSKKVAEQIGAFGFTSEEDQPLYMTYGEWYEEETTIDDRYFSIVGDETYQNMTVVAARKAGIMAYDYFRKRYRYDGTVKFAMGALYVDDDVVDDDPTVTSSSNMLIGPYTLPDRILYWTGTIDGKNGTPDDIPSAVKLYIKGQDPVEITKSIEWYPIYADFTTNGDVAYLDQYDETTDTCDLMLYQNGTHTTLDTGVTMVISYTYTDHVQDYLFMNSPIFQNRG